MKSYSPMSVLVRSGEYWRVFTTESFSIRPIVNHLQRYNPNYTIIAIKYGYFPSEIIPNNTSWQKLTNDEEMATLNIVMEEEIFNITPSVPNLKTHLLEHYPFRTALSMFYRYAAERAIYPSKSVFRGVEVSDIPEWLIAQMGRCERLTFVSDTDNPYIEKSDILKYYDGRRIERMINGQKVSGYLLDNPRITIENNKD